MSWRRPLDENALALSFLDLLSCGLGAAALMFMVFSAINRGAGDKPGRPAAGGMASNWQSDGVAAPLELIARFEAPIVPKNFCWLGLERLNAIGDEPRCGVPRTADDGSAVAAGDLLDEGTEESNPESGFRQQEFHLVLPGGLPPHTIGVRVLPGDEPAAERGLLALARIAGEQRTFRPRGARSASREVTFWLNPRHWPARTAP